MVVPFTLKVLTDSRLFQQIRGSERTKDNAILRELEGSKRKKSPFPAPPNRPARSLAQKPTHPPPNPPTPPTQLTHQPPPRLPPNPPTNQQPAKQVFQLHHCA